MKKEEKEDIELDIEAKYVDKTEKEFLSRVTYAECLYILTPKNEYCDKIIELSVLKLCEIIGKLQKENEELKFKERSRIIGKYGDTEIHDVINRTLSNDYIPIQKVKDILEQKDKIIDLMADDIHGTQAECNRYFKDKEDVKQYIENKAKELLNK